jgi:hypothetical protein
MPQQSFIEGFFCLADVARDSQLRNGYGHGHGKLQSWPHGPFEG